MMTAIGGTWSESSNAWVSDVLHVTEDLWLEIKLPKKGRIVIKESETENGPWPKAFISSWCGPEVKIRLQADDEGRYIKIYATEIPERIEYANIHRQTNSES